MRKNLTRILVLAMTAALFNFGTGVAQADEAVLDPGIFDQFEPVVTIPWDLLAGLAEASEGGDGGGETGVIQVDPGMFDPIGPVVDPSLIDWGALIPAPADPGPAEPGPAEPAPAEPAPAEPAPAEPAPAEPADEPDEEVTETTEAEEEEAVTETTQAEENEAVTETTEAEEASDEAAAEEAVAQDEAAAENGGWNAEGVLLTLAILGLMGTAILIAVVARRSGDRV
jgi:hypothetical protein